MKKRNDVEINGTIESTMLGIEHGSLTYFLHLTCGDGGVQGAGGINLSGYEKCAEYLEKLLSTVGVSEWSLLRGKHVRFVRSGGVITKVGHIVEDRWFNVVPEVE